MRLVHGALIASGSIQTRLIEKLFEPRGRGLTESQQMQSDHRFSMIGCQYTLTWTQGLGPKKTHLQSTIVYILIECFLKDWWKSF